MKILLLEADKLLAENLVQVLKLDGHKVIWQVDPQKAIETIDAEEPGAIILDLVLAGRSGVEFLYELRSYPEWHSLPVHIWSDLSDNEVSALTAGLQDLNIASYHHKSGVALKNLAKALSSQPATA